MSTQDLSNAFYKLSKTPRTKSHVYSTTYLLKTEHPCPPPSPPPSLRLPRSPSDTPPRTPPPHSSTAFAPRRNVLRGDKPPSPSPSLPHKHPPAPAAVTLQPQYPATQ